jgi:hypothetical protein
MRAKSNFNAALRCSSEVTVASEDDVDALSQKDVEDNLWEGDLVAMTTKTTQTANAAKTSDKWCVCKRVNIDHFLILSASLSLSLSL